MGDHLTGLSNETGF